MSSFSVAAIVNEPPEVIDRFADWYLSQGADRIILFFDDPDDRCAADLDGRDRFEIRRCTTEFWQEIGIDPAARFTLRQNAALSHAYRGTVSDWLLNVDADELMFFRGQSIAQAVAGFPADARAVGVQTAEAVCLEAEGRLAFRTPIPRPLVREIYGEDALYLARRHGLAGHPEGKSFIRSGQAGISLRQHWATDDTGQRIPGPILGAADGAFLLHFMVEDYQSWRDKLDWRVGSWGYPGPIKDRVGQIRESAADPEADLRRLYDALHRLTPDRAAALREAKSLHDFEFGG